MPTALELSRKGWKRYLDAVRHRPPPPDLTPMERREREHVLTHVRKAASMLKSRYGVSRVVLFGSLAHAAWFMPDSDVDLAVEGLASNDFWHAWRDVEVIIADRRVDLIDIETSRESLRKTIDRHGVEL